MIWERAVAVGLNKAGRHSIIKRWLSGTRHQGLQPNRGRAAMPGPPPFRAAAHPAAAQRMTARPTSSHPMQQQPAASKGLYISRTTSLAKTIQNGQANRGKAGNVQGTHLSAILKREHHTLSYQARRAFDCFSRLLYCRFDDLYTHCRVTACQGGCSSRRRAASAARRPSTRCACRCHPAGCAAAPMFVLKCCRVCVL